MVWMDTFLYSESFMILIFNALFCRHAFRIYICTAFRLAWRGARYDCSTTVEEGGAVRVFSCSSMANAIGGEHPVTAEKLLHSPKTQFECNRIREPSGD